MSLTLGLNTALSGLMTSQRGLDVISQNVVNVNTVGYTRKVMNPESKVLAGKGSGVQEGSVTRMVSEGLLKDIRRQQTNTGRLEVEQSYYPRIDDLFGEVADETSVAHRMNDLFSAFQTLSSGSNKPAVQWSTMQSAQDVADQLGNMTRSLQDFRVQADREIEDSVGAINESLNNIHDLNQKIVKNAAVSSGTTDLEDKRDLELTKLAKQLDIQYYKRADGALTIYSSSGQMLLDNQPQPLSYTSSSTTATWMTAAGGQFSKLTVEGGSQDFGPEITGGKLRALLDMRDTTLPNLQANLDEMADKLKDTLNLAHNRGTSLPNMSSRYEGTRTFAKQGDIVDTQLVDPDTAMTFYYGASSITSGAGGGGGAGFSDISIAADATNPWRVQFASGLPAAAGPFDAVNFAPGKVFSINGAENARNNGTYRVVSYTDASTITVEKVNPTQTIQLNGTDDVVLATFDASGNQLKQTTLRSIMDDDLSSATSYDPTDSTTYGTGRSKKDFEDKDPNGPWTINEVSGHVEAWLRSQGYSNASVNLDADGKMIVDTGDATVALAFRDQASSTLGADQSDATIHFDVDGDGTRDQTIKGFSNFFGLNDLYENPNQSAIFDSNVQPKSFTTPANRDLRLFDSTGKIGNTISIPKGATLDTIAAAINNQTRTNESTTLDTTAWTLTSDATITVSDASGSVATVTLLAGAHSLEEIAGLLTQSSLTGSVVQDGSSSRLRLTDSRGAALNVSISGGAIAGSTMSLGETLDMSQSNRIQASVEPEGSGYRLRIRQTEGGELFVSSTLIAGQNLLSDLGLEQAATGTASNMAVREDIRTAPEKISRGAMQWNADLSRYYLSEGDNTVALQMSTAMSSKTDLDSAGAIAKGKYTFAEYAAATISVLATSSNNSKDQMDYQTSLNASLDFQNASFSGVNIDEEISAMMDYQQAYAASAKVITVMQDMLETLTSMIR